MKQKLGKSLCSMLLTLAMVIGLMPWMSLTAYAAETTVTWTSQTLSDHYQDGFTTEGVTLTTEGDSRLSNYFYGYGYNSFSVSDGMRITKIVIESEGSTCELNDFPGATVSSHVLTAEEILERYPFYSEYPEMLNDMVGRYRTDTITWTGNAETVRFRAWISPVTKITFTIEPATVSVTGVSLDKTTASIPVGGEPLTLTPTVSPDNATDKTVTWTTSDASVATVADGVVTAVAAGTATITATATNGTVDTSDDKTATCTVTVVPAPVDPTKPDTPTPEPVTPASDTEVPADTTPSGSSSPAPVVSAEQSRAMTVSNFVERLYLTALNRSYDVTGRDNWVDQIINKDASGSSIARGFFNSQEFIARELDNEEFVNTLYRVFFDREPDTQGFTNWINALENGATRSEVINEFAGSTEWTSMCARYGINA